jgi:glutathione S-transferase
VGAVGDDQSSAFKTSAVVGRLDQSRRPQPLSATIDRAKYARTFLLFLPYLCIKSGSDLWPAHNPSEQVELLRWLSWNDWHWARVTGDFYFEQLVKKTCNIGAPPDSEALKPKIPGLQCYAGVLNAHLQGLDYVARGRLTIADFQLAAMACYWRESEMPLAEFPNIVRWLDGLGRIPAWRDRWPEEVEASAA